MLITPRAENLSLKQVNNMLSHNTSKELFPNSYFLLRPTLRVIGLLVSLLFIVAMTYGPVLNAEYAFADDYFYLWSRVHQPDWIANLLIEGIVQARPMDGFLLILALTAIKSVGSYIFLRVFTLLEVAGLAFLTYRLLAKSGWTKLQSFFLSLSLLSLPPVQVICAWSNTSFYLFAAALAYVSVQIIMDRRFGKAFVQIISAILPLLISMTIYQPWTMFYWLVLAIRLTSNALTNQEKLSRLRAATVVFFLTAVLDFFVMIIGKAYFKHIRVSPDRSHLTKHVIEKIIWFINGPLVDALNVNHLMAAAGIAIAAGLYILGGLWLYLKTKDRRQTLLSFVIALLLIPLAYLPNLAIAESFYTYRTEFGLSVLVLFYIYLSTKAYLEKVFKTQAKSILTVVIVVTSILNLVVAHNHLIDFFVSPQLNESDGLKAQLRGDFGKVRQAHPVYLERRDTTAPFNRHDEFGMPSFACPWVRDPGTIMLRDEINKANLHEKSTVLR